MKLKEESWNSGKILNMLLIALSGIILLLLGVWIGRGLDSIFPGQGSDKYPSATVKVMEVPVQLPFFKLTDHNGEEFALWNFTKSWSFVFFGYTNCPDVCPTALMDMNNIYRNLVDRGDLIEKKYEMSTQFVFVSVDPQRDTVEQVKEYVHFFNKDFIGVTGDPEEIQKVAQKLGIGFRRMPGKDREDYYAVDHSASLLLIDPLGCLRAIILPPHDPQQIAKDFRKIRAEFIRVHCIVQ